MIPQEHPWMRQYGFSPCLSLGMPSSFDLVELPSAASLTETEGT